MIPILFSLIIGQRNQLKIMWKGWSQIWPEDKRDPWCFWINPKTMKVNYNTKFAIRKFLFNKFNSQKVVTSIRQKSSMRIHRVLNNFFKISTKAINMIRWILFRNVNPPNVPITKVWENNFKKEIFNLKFLIKKQFKFYYFNFFY